MELKKLQFFENVKHHVQREFVESQTQCVLCGTELEFHHISDLNQKTIREEAHCPQCSLRTKNKTYQLH